MALKKMFPSFEGTIFLLYLKKLFFIFLHVRGGAYKYPFFLSQHLNVFLTKLEQEIKTGEGEKGQRRIFEGQVEFDAYEKTKIAELNAYIEKKKY